MDVMMLDVVDGEGRSDAKKGHSPNESQNIEV